METTTRRTANEEFDDNCRGSCPMCGEPILSNCYYIGGKGYIIAWECAGYLTEPRTCDYRRIL